ncbi:MAG: glutathione ABC transporter permease GsiC [Candidatus Methanophagaceae archaeon]|nr:MAG: glutathione ABC transporter permease GsiC [Methanophagales archaeon]
MLNYILKRIILLAPILLLVSLITFSILYIIPGDPAETILTGPGGAADPKAVEEFRVKMGLDRPLHIQYLKWLNNVLHGNFGYSYMTEQPVLDPILPAFRATLKLAVASMILSLLISIPVGIISAIKQYSLIDNLSMTGALLGVSMPNFWQGLLLILLFAVYLGWFPVAGYGENGDFEHLVLPAITLGTSSAAITTRLMRSSMLETIRQDYIQAARAKGLSERVVIGKHALKNALIPVVTVAGLNFGYLLDGSVVVETIFAWPGIGKLMVGSIYMRDYPMIQGCILFVALVYVAVNLVVDILYTFLDPRIRYETKAKAK